MVQPRSNVEWESWGKSDPLYGVASLEGRNKRGSNPWTEDDFYAYGAQIWLEYKCHWEGYGVDRRSCVEIGCGAGRMTKQLGEYFQEVHAVDISREMIEYARPHVNSERVSFHLANGTVLPLADSSATAAFSSDVFQHFDQARYTENYFVELFRVLDAGGSMMIHLPVYSWPNALRRTFSALYKLREIANSLKAEIRRTLLQRGLGNPFMYGRKYEAGQLYKFLRQVGFRDIEIRFFENTGDSDLPDFRSYVFARKPLRPDPKPFS